MPLLPLHIKEYFFETLKGNIALTDFEQWLYHDQELEQALSPDDYLDLIALSYKKEGARHDLYALLQKHVDVAEFETCKLRHLLQEARQKNERLPYILMAFYHLYCKGYSFLSDLGLGYGLSVAVPGLDGTYADSWDDLSPGQQEELLQKLSPGLEQELDRILGWLETGKIFLTGEQDESGHYGYEDYRTTEEKR